MKQLVFAAGLLHLCQLPSMVIAPRMLGWKSDLAKLDPINRRIVQVIGVAIMIVVIGLGVVVMVAPGGLTDGSPLAAAFTGFLGLFWLYRAIVQAILYRKIWPGGFLGRASHYGLTGLFFGLTGIYLSALVWNLTR